jgi:prepilin-type N-terminal cleavage/methylation domain-containing protein
MGCARCAVKAAKAFTLIELLAVIGIMLILMTGVFGVLGLLAQEAGPEAAVSTLQAMLNSARDYAASEGVDAQVVFSVDTAKGADGTTMALQYHETDPAKGVGWYYVRGRKPFVFHGRIYICQGMPSGFPAPKDKNGNSLVLGDIDGWKWYGQTILTGPWPSSSDADTASRGMSGFALNADGSLKDAKPGPLNFNVTISPTGYMNTDVASTTTVVGFTIIQVGGTRVIGYVFYPLNPNTGTRLLFE